MHVPQPPEVAIKNAQPSQALFAWVDLAVQCSELRVLSSSELSVLGSMQALSAALASTAAETSAPPIEI